MLKVLGKAVLCLAAVAVIAGGGNFPVPSKAFAGSDHEEWVKPGLGEIMGVVGQHHAKLFFAGHAGNWKLAAYQLDEIKEGLEKAERLHPDFKNISIPLPRLIPQMMGKGVERVNAAIAMQDEKDFPSAFDAITASCNACHRAAGYGFIVIQRPDGAQHGNMSFDSEPPLVGRKR